MIVTELISKIGHQRAEFFRFLLVGASVTILSLILAYVFLECFATPLIPTYILLYMGTIYLSYLLNRAFTFKAKGSTRKAFKFYIVYLVTLSLGTIALRVLRQNMSFDDWILVCMVVPFTTVINYLLSRWILVGYVPKDDGLHDV